MKVFDHLILEGIYWAGRLDDVEFLQRIFDLTDLPSHDSRFRDAESDIWQHRINNNDWQDDWIYRDPRFNLVGTDDDTFLQFLCQIVQRPPRWRCSYGRRIRIDRVTRR